MSSFTSEPEFRQRKDGKFIITKGFTYWVGEKNSNHFIEIPSGMATDFASIPKILHSIFSPYNPKWMKASLVHDYLYCKQGYSTIICEDKHHFYFPTRRHADYIFWEAMGVLGANIFVRILFWLAVRLGGRKSFRKYSLTY